MPLKIGSRSERIEALHRAAILIRDGASRMDGLNSVGAWMYEIAAELEQRAWVAGSVEPKKADGKKDGL